MLYFYEQAINLKSYEQELGLANSTFKFFDLNGTVQNSTPIEKLVYIDFNNNSIYDASELLYNFTGRKFSEFLGAEYGIRSTESPPPSGEWLRIGA